MLQTFPIFPLIIKELWTKAANISAIWIALIIGSILLNIFYEKVGIITLFAFPVFMSFFLSLFYMEWLISEEQENKTFLWIRTMPISAHSIVNSKIISLIVLLSAHPLSIIPSIFLNEINWIVFLITLITTFFAFCFCIWGMLIFLVMKGMNRYIIPTFAILFLSIIGISILKEFSAMSLPLPKLSLFFSLLFVIMVLITGIGWRLMCCYFTIRDSLDLVE